MAAKFVILAVLVALAAVANAGFVGHAPLAYSSSHLVKSSGPGIKLSSPVLQPVQAVAAPLEYVPTYKSLSYAGQYSNVYKTPSVYGYAAAPALSYAPAIKYAASSPVLKYAAAPTLGYAAAPALTYAASAPLTHTYSLGNAHYGYAHGYQTPHQW